VVEFNDLPALEAALAPGSEYGLPWTVQRLGCRAEYWLRPVPPRNGEEAAAAMDPELERYMHLAALNRGILLTPFHNMALIAPAVTSGARLSGEVVARPGL
jgi:glutamate-1-semialdehyde aminotransferase